MVQETTTKTQEVHDLFPRVEMPRGEDVIILKYAKGENKGEYVVSLDQKQQLLLGQEISREISPKGDQRYTLMPLQRSYDLIHSDSKEGKDFKKLMESYWAHNREAFRRPNIVYPDPMVVEVEGNLVYEGQTKEVKINDGDVFDTLMRAGLFKEPKQKVWRGSVYFDDNGESSVWSSWDRDEGCFAAGSFRPSCWYSVGLAVFGKTDERTEVRKREVSEIEYQALLRDSRKLRELEPQVTRLSEQLENIKRIVR